MSRASALYQESVGFVSSEFTLALEFPAPSRKIRPNREGPNGVAKKQNTQENKTEHR